MCLRIVHSFVLDRALSICWHWGRSAGYPSSLSDEENRLATYIELFKINGT